MFSLLGLITLKESLANHPKVRTTKTLWRSECSSQHMLLSMNCTVGKKLKCKAKMRSCLNESETDTFVIWYCSVSSRNLLEVWVWSCRTTILSPAHCSMQIWLTLSYFIQQLFDAYGEVTFWGYNPENHMSRIEKTQKLINDEPK